MAPSASSTALSSYYRASRRLFNKSQAQSVSSALVGVVIGYTAACLQQSQNEEHQQQEKLEQHVRTVKAFLKQFQTTVNLQPLSMIGFDAFFSEHLLQRFDTERAMCESKLMVPTNGFTVLGRLSRRQGGRTFRLLESTRESDHLLESRYEIDWESPIGEGTFGSVYRATDMETGEQVAIKKISKKCSLDSETFQHEMNAMMTIRAHGGHDNICGLRANYDQGGYLYLVLDMIDGGELFDHLSHHGAYSEEDASRLLRQVASALAFLHSLDIVHGDLKPENLMLSTANRSDSAVKLVDFGSAQFCKAEDEALAGPEDQDRRLPSSRRRRHRGSAGTAAAAAAAAATTTAYSSPEFLANNDDDCEIDPAFDMWALGVILYVMLTGVHPFDLYGDASDAELQEIIASGTLPAAPRRLTAHLSPQANNVIGKLLEKDPSKRVTAQELLEDEWILHGGETTIASTSMPASEDATTGRAAMRNNQDRRRVYGIRLEM